MRRRWSTWLVAAGLATLFAGRRIVRDGGASSVALTGAGLIAVALGVAVSLRDWRRAEPGARSLERMFALAHLGCLLSLAAYHLGAEGSLEGVGIELETAMAQLRLRRAFLVGGTILLGVSLAPALTGAWAAGRHGGEGEGGLRVRVRRTLDVAVATLNVVLAGAFLMIAGYVASAHDVTVDASYFKTASPGSAVQQIVRGMPEPLRVVLFFPEVDPVKDELRSYFRALAASTDNVVIEERDRLAEPGAAARYDVSDDGTVILGQGDRTRRFGVPTDLAAARATLRTVDGVVQRTLLELGRARLVAYLSVGHGELADAENATAERGGGARAGEARGGEGPRLEALRLLLDDLGYDVRELGLRTGLGEAIPDDAALLMVIGPRRPFLPEELSVVDDYLASGGSLLVALEPGTGFDLGPLRARLGVDFVSEPLTDDRRFVRQRGGPSDRRLIVTDLFRAHPAVATTSRGGVGSGVLLVGAGHLEPIDVEGAPAPTLIVESLPSTFADLDGDFFYDEGTERRGGYGIAAAVEAPGGADVPMRGLVYADADLFSDAVLTSLGTNVALVADGVRWLGREESFAGAVSSEEDVPIVHTKAEDVVWFYAIILGAPGLVLAFGFLLWLGPRFGRAAPREAER